MTQATSKARKTSPLFRHMQAQQGGRPWGRVLDAGTGPASLRWIAGLETDSWTAITASERERTLSREAVSDQIRAQDRILKGSWTDPTLLEGEHFDTVIADYLLGAIDGFAPYFQSFLFARLRPLVGRTLYVSGLDPYVPLTRPDDRVMRMLWSIGRYRDSCMLLSGRMPYREYPADWVSDHLQASGYRVDQIWHFNIRFNRHFVDAQIDMCRPGLDALDDRELATSLLRHGETLRQQAHDIIRSEGALRAGRNYVVCATPI